ncbi:MAG TPA: hypothetical protein EYP04_08735 [Anaerolineae bacterium]|nr:hypothetical protein [Anaerolineae bacterium]
MKGMVLLLVNLIAGLYLVTSGIVVVNGFVWLPTMPSFWYDVEAVMYWPFQPYFDLAFALLGHLDLPYWAYALLTRAPFFLIPLLILVGAVRSIKKRRSR